MRKINWKRIIVYSLWFIVFSLLIYTRFVNLGWGLPYPMHPDERNMAVAVQSLNCEIQNSKFKIQNCFNPHFFAYGQFPLFLSYFSIQISHLFTGKFGQPISFIEATLALRIFSAISSVLTVFVMMRIVNILVIQDKKKKFSILYSPFFLLILIFSPVLIQFAHFGTTESLLILFYSLIIYSSLLFLQKKILNSPYVPQGKQFSILNSIFCGLALATKVSSTL